MGNSSIGDLFVQLRDGDRDAAEELVNTLSGMVVRTVRNAGVMPSAVEDVAATTWLKLFENVDRVSEPKAVAGWLRTTAHNESMQWHRKQKRAGPAIDSVGFDLPVDEVGFELLENRAIDQARITAVQAVFDSLSDRCRTILALKSQTPRLSNKQVATELGVPLGSVGPTYSRCLAKLRVLLKGSFSELG